jgi:hypothetical protein
MGKDDQRACMEATAAANEIIDFRSPRRIRRPHWRNLATCKGIVDAAFCVAGVQGGIIQVDLQEKASRPYPYPCQQGREPA